MNDNSEIRGYADEELSEHALRLRVADLRARVAELERERDAYKTAKAENDERFMLERDEARAERDRYEAALVARHGGEPVELLRELDAARAEVERLRVELEREHAEVEELREKIDCLRVHSPGCNWQQRGDAYPCSCMEANAEVERLREALELCLRTMPVGPTYYEPAQQAARAALAGAPSETRREEGNPKHVEEIKRLAGYVAKLMRDRRALAERVREECAKRCASVPLTTSGVYANEVRALDLDALLKEEE